MAAITVTAAQVSVLHPEKAMIYDFIAAEALTPGQAVYINSNGKVAKADATTNKQVKGLALAAASAGQGVSILKEGYIVGLDMSGMAYDAQIMLSSTAGGLDTTGTILIGRVVSVPDKAITKAAFIFVDWVPTRS
jgi:hypothetical protein